MTDSDKPVIGLVGPCKSGKTTLKRQLVELGYTVKHIAQEHSYAQQMWKKIANPDVLIFLQVSFPVTIERSTLTWSESEYQTQLQRLAHAFEHADLVIDTDDKTPEGIFSLVIDFLEKRDSAH